MVRSSPMMSLYLYWPLLTICCGYALLRGRRNERWTATICIVASVISVLLREPVYERYVGLEWGDLLIDVGVLGAFVAIALQSDRFWPLWVAGLQFTTSFSHFLRALDAGLIPQAYAAAERFWSYPILLILLLGAWRQHRRMRHYPDQEIAA
jgi:hypothetical protein